MVLRDERVALTPRMAVDTGDTVVFEDGLVSWFVESGTTQTVFLGHDANAFQVLIESVYRMLVLPVPTLDTWVKINASTHILVQRTQSLPPLLLAYLDVSGWFNVEVRHSWWLLRRHFSLAWHLKWDVKIRFPQSS